MRDLSENWYQGILRSVNGDYFAENTIMLFQDGGYVSSFNVRFE